MLSELTFQVANCIVICVRKNQKFQSYTHHEIPIRGVFAREFRRLGYAV